MAIGRLRHVKIPNLDGLIMHYSPHNAPKTGDLHIFTNPLNPKYLSLHDRVKCQDPDVLTWTFNPHVSTKVLALSSQRNHLKRRWNRAFLYALKERGFAKDGKRVATQPGERKVSGLTGTLEVLITQGTGFDLPILQLYERASVLVQALERVNARA